MRGTSLVAQWLRLCAPNAGDLGSIPGQGTIIPHVAQHGQKKIFKKKKRKENVYNEVPLHTGQNGHH